MRKSFSVFVYLFLASIYVYGQSETELNAIRGQIASIWAQKKQAFKNNMSSGLSPDYENTLTLYDIQEQTNNLLVYAINEHQNALLDELAEVYLVAHGYLRPLTEKKIGTLCEVQFSPQSSWSAWMNVEYNEDVLSSAQFLYLLAKTLNSIQQIPPETRNTFVNLNEFTQKYVPVLVSHYQRWLTVDKTFQTKGWGCNSGCLNAKEFLEKKLINAFSGGQVSYCNVVQDCDMWMIAGVAELLAANYHNPGLVPLSIDNSVLFKDFVRVGTSLLKSRFFPVPALNDFNNSPVTGTVLDPIALAGYSSGGVTFEGHSDYAYAGSSTTTSCPSESWPSSITWDISHGRRWVHVFESLFENRNVTGQAFPDKAFIVTMANQFLYKVFNRNYLKPAFSNYFDGTNGWYRYEYEDRPNEGTGPWQNSLAAITGGFCFWSKYNPDFINLRQALLDMARSSDPQVKEHINRYYGTSSKCTVNGVTITNPLHDLYSDASINMLQFLPTFFPGEIKPLTYSDNLITCFKKDGINTIFKSWNGNTIGHQVYGSSDANLPVLAITSGNFDTMSDDVVTAFDAAGNSAIYKNQDADRPGGDVRVYTSTYWDVVDMCTGDFDGDGDDELVTAFHSTEGDAIYINESGNSPGDGDVAVYHTTQWLIVAVTAGDFDGDGDDELIMTTRDANGVTRIFKDEDGQHPESLKIYESTYWKVIDMTAGDFDGNNDDELITAFRTVSTGEDAIYYSESAMSPSSTKTYGSTYWKVASLTTGDFDGNGNEELITAFNCAAGGALYISDTGYSPGSNRIFGVDPTVVFTHVTAGQYMTPPNGTRQRGTEAVNLIVVKQEDNIRLFPNPVTSEFKSEFKIVHPTDEPIRSLSMYDLSGKANNSFVRVGNKIEVSDTPKGMYIIKVAYATQTWIGKVLIK